MKKFQYIILLAWVVYSNIGCNKLDVKPNQALVVPSTLQDAQGLMDNSQVFNTNCSVLREISSNDFNMTAANYNSLANTIEKNAYIWEKNTFAGLSTVPDWDGNYSRVLYCNITLDALQNLDPMVGSSNYNYIKGQALYQRANAFFTVAQEFSLPYAGNSSNTDLGIPLRLTSDLNNLTSRSTIKETYNQIIGDLLSAKSLLPNTTSYLTRPSKAAAYALLSRVYLTMGDYRNAYLNADSCLQLYSTLINYNTLSASTAYPFLLLNSEVIFQATMNNLQSLLPARATIYDDFYQTYVTNDLRKTLFFTGAAGSYTFKGNYNGSSGPLFCGIATDEMYLTRAECLARLQRTNDAMFDLNTLLTTRFKTGTYISRTATSPDDALSQILVERRKELLLRGVRWMDLRRLNLDSRFAITLTRTVGTQTYTLPPNDSRYTFPIPDYVINYTGIQQNP